ncbi:hypothetical protein BC938DRAFT_483583 [Jimgerdemannia flammicorona]|uniref:Uncharacterized protein n=1 Tax=Jimgerdemannia flammicorona TaxID=994334 RepID=A0A433QBR0_9FUNG|nr:hypothetical protein BC938DRAFT_483583 [Jimgerdemannia flammicorona]
MLEPPCNTPLLSLRLTTNYRDLFRLPTLKSLLLLSRLRSRSPRSLCVRPRRCHGGRLLAPVLIFVLLVGAAPVAAGAPAPAGTIPPSPRPIATDTPTPAGTIIPPAPVATSPIAADAPIPAGTIRPALVATSPIAADAPTRDPAGTIPPTPAATSLVAADAPSPASAAPTPVAPSRASAATVSPTSLPKQF